MNRDKRESEYPPELESHFIMRLPEEPANQLRHILKGGENLKNRLTIQVENDMRSGEVRFDHWLMHAKIVDLPTIIESLKTIDTKSFYKCADICQMMICKTEADQSPEEEAPAKAKKKDRYKVDKKNLWPHGITPPTKNVRKRRFRKTLRKKCVEAPEIEKEVKRLLRADNEAVSITWEMVKEDDGQKHNSGPRTTAQHTKSEKKPKIEKTKWEPNDCSFVAPRAANEQSNVVDIFGGAVSDSEEEDSANVEMDDSHLSTYDSRLSDTNSMQGVMDLQNKGTKLPTQFGSEMFHTPNLPSKKLANKSWGPMPGITVGGGGSSEEDGEKDCTSRDMAKDVMQFKIEQVKAELEELKQSKKRIQYDYAGLENLALRQRFQNILHTLNQDIMYKDMEYQGMLVMQNSEDV